MASDLFKPRPRDSIFVSSIIKIQKMIRCANFSVIPVFIRNK